MDKKTVFFKLMYYRKNSVSIINCQQIIAENFYFHKFSSLNNDIGYKN